MINKDKPYVIGIGEIYNESYQGKEIVGGVPLDFAYSGCIAGYKGGVISATGNDEDGAWVERVLKLRGLSDFCSKSTKYRTGKVHLTNDKSRFVDHDVPQDWAWTKMEAPENLKDLAQQTRMVGWSAMAIQYATTRKVIKDFVTQMDPTDTFKVFNMNIYFMQFTNLEALKEALQLCNVLETNAMCFQELYELLEVSDACSMDEVCWLLMEKYDIKYIIYNCSCMCEVYHGKEKFTLHNHFNDDGSPDNMYLLDGAAYDVFFLASLLRGQDISQSQTEAVRALRYCGKTDYWFQKRILFLLDRTSRLLTKHAFHQLVDKYWRDDSTTTEVLGDMLTGSLRMMMHYDNLVYPKYEPEEY